MRVSGFVLSGFMFGYGYRSLVIRLGGPAHGFLDIAFFCVVGTVIYFVAWKGR